jgi:hypothetical protein
VVRVPTFGLGPESIFEVFIAQCFVQKPVAISWDDDNHVLIAEKAGVVRINDGWTGNNAAVLLDIQNEVASYGDHGLTSVLYYNGFLWATYMKLNPAIGNDCADYGQFDGRTASQVLLSCSC